MLQVPRGSGAITKKQRRIVRPFRESGAMPVPGRSGSLLTSFDQEQRTKRATFGLVGSPLLSRRALRPTGSDQSHVNPSRSIFRRALNICRSAIVALVRSRSQIKGNCRPPAFAATGAMLFGAQCVRASTAWVAERDHDNRQEQWKKGLRRPCSTIDTFA
jgi:hypothetical protein